MPKSQVNPVELRYQRLVEKNRRLHDQLRLPMVPISQASLTLVQYVKNIKDPLVPSVWGPTTPDPFASKDQNCCAIL
ncbi:hypothetical protein H4R35_000024 [Dimargaris xerosporica]|nr:hypothetical protein H4R35_000024 [Dimargaris xerosporica]